VTAFAVGLMLAAGVFRFFIFFFFMFPLRTLSESAE
jgi:hypothetical protein